MKNGKLVDMDGQTVVVGYALPGLKDGQSGNVRFIIETDEISK